MSTTTNIQALARTDEASPLPVFNATQMTQALSAYKQLQRSLDEAMPDAIMNLDGKQFRKKSYWRAVAVAFNLTVEPVTPERDERTVVGLLEDGVENYVYTVTYRAATPGGRSSTGDGACAASEKAKGRMKASEHNVRSHAHTRAYNRAVSNLVGFGEVSAEEVEREEHHVDGEVIKPRPSSPKPDAPGQPAAQAAARTTTVKGVEVKTGKKGEKAWTRYGVTFGDGRRASTFDTKLGQACQVAAGSGEAVNPEILKGEKGQDLKGLQPTVAERKLEPEVARGPDEPVSGPEKVLLARKVTRQDGSHYCIVQTAKRELFTVDEAKAREAGAARRADLGIVPSFTVGPWPGVDRPVNVLTGFVVETPALVVESYEVDLAAEAEAETREPGGED